MYRLRILLPAVFLLIASFLKAQSYFPLHDSSTYFYTGRFNGETYHDTIMLFSVKGWPEEDRRGGPLFYFKDMGEEGPFTDLIGNGLFLGAYFYVQDSLFFVHATSLEDLGGRSKSEGQLILTFPLTEGQKRKVKAYDGDSTFIRVLRFEDTEAEGKKFERTAVIERTTYIRGGLFSTDLFWLADQIGIVKMQRITGRTDELTRYLPGSQK